MNKQALSALIRKTAFKVNRKLYENCDFVVLHDKEDHKYGFLPEHKPGGLIKDSKRTKGKPYVKNGETIYNVVIDMYEDPRFKDPEGDLADIWVGTREEAEKQLEEIKKGKGGGTHFVRIIDVPKNKKMAQIERTWREIQAEYSKKYGENHHCLKLECIKCGNNTTCRCSTSKALEKGICYYCTGEIER